MLKWKSNFFKCALFSICLFGQWPVWPKCYTLIFIQWGFFLCNTIQTKKSFSRVKCKVPLSIDYFTTPIRQDKTIMQLKAVSTLHWWGGWREGGKHTVVHPPPSCCHLLQFPAWSPSSSENWNGPSDPEDSQCLWTLHCWLTVVRWRLQEVSKWHGADPFPNPGVGCISSACLQGTGVT